MLSISNVSNKFGEVKTKLMSLFEMRDMGQPKNFRGINIKTNRETRVISLTQENYIETILSKFGFDEEFPQSTPMITRQVANHERRQREEDENKEF